MGEKKFTLGALFSKFDIRDYIASTKLTEFPDEFELKLPKVKNQGSVNSCVAHSLSTIVEYFNQKESGKYKQMSTNYIYGNRRLTWYKGSGMYTKDAIKTVTKYGDVPNELLSGNVEVPEAINKFEAAFDAINSEGYFFKFLEYFKLKNEAAIKTALMEHGPVVITMNWFEDIQVVNGVMQTSGSGNTRGGHCMVIYGWNETGWKVRNSWGRTWGDKGNVVIPYNVPVKETWGIRDADGESDLDVKKPFSGKIGAMFAGIINDVVEYFSKLWKKFKGEI